MEIVMTIAGSDSGGGAGIQADLKTFQELGVYGTSTITALTAQNTQGVADIMAVEPSFITKQMQAVFEDMNVVAVKTGMLYSAEIIEAVTKEIQHQNALLVVDPVMIAKGGANLLKQEAIRALKTHLLPIATVVTPNIPEAEELTNMKIETVGDIEKAAQEILALGVQCVVIKGGHLEGPEAVDFVYFQDEAFFAMSSERIDTLQTHGTGCTFSAALTAFLAKGYTLRDAIIEAKHYIQAAISFPLNIGHGHGPTNHFAYNKEQMKGKVKLH